MNKCVHCGKEYKKTKVTDLLCPECNSKAGTVESPNLIDDIRSYNVGTSDYSKHKIQPWDIWIEYKLNPFDADIVKRILRTKSTDSRKMDYEKIIHICKERIRQIDAGIEL